MSDPSDRRTYSFTDRDFGRLETEVVSLKAQNARLEANQQQMNDKLDVLVSAVTEAKGGWKMLMLVGSASAAVGVIVSKTLIFFKGG